MTSQINQPQPNGQTNGTDDKLHVSRFQTDEPPMVVKVMSLSSASSGGDDESSNRDELTEDALVNNDMAAAFGTKDNRGSTQKMWQDVLAHIKEESRTGLNFISSGGAFGQDLTFAYGIDLNSLRELFPPDQDDHTLRLEHQQLSDVVREIFVEHNIEVPANRRSSSLQKMFERAETHNFILFLRQMSCLSFSRQGAARVVQNPIFSGFFIVLTLYALFVPDFVNWALRAEDDELFTIVNTVVWIFFILEIIMLVRGINGYWRTIPCLLDVVAMLSFVSDTWFMKSELFGSEDGNRAARMTRQTRLTRLVRVARVARITKLVPKIMSCFGHQKKEITNFTLERRLWRAFRYLDGRNSGEITMFDFNILYLTLVQECQRMLGTKSKDIVLKEDLPRLRAFTLKGVNMSFESFLTILRSSTLGRAMYDYHLQDLQDAKGGYAMTHEIADRSSLKVCIGILVLVIMMKLLDAETAETEQSSLQLLGMLDFVARGSYGKTFVYAQIREYITDSTAMFIWIDGFRYLDNPGAPINDPVIPMSIDSALQAVDRIQEQAGLRQSEVLLSCLPDYENCALEHVRSMTLTNVASTTRTNAAWALLQTSVIVTLLLMFISAFNMGVGKFTKTLLRPLRAITDDMLAMSCLELVEIDIDEMPQLSGGKVNEAQEAIHLQNAFKRMCLSIRSWSKYVPPVVVQRLMTCGMEATIGVSRCNVSILFVDIDGFEDMCRGLGPTDILSMLSTALGNIAEVIAQHKGTLLEFIGDEVVAVFGAPSMLRNHSYYCASSAVHIHNAMRRMQNIMLEDGQLVQISCRSAVHTASVLAGNMGSQKRMKYGLLGDGVNLTARFKTLNSRYRTQTLATAQLMEDEKVLSDFAWRPIDRVAVKGKTEPTNVYELLDNSDSVDFPQLLSLAEAHRHGFELYQSRCFKEAKTYFHEVHSLLDDMGRQDEPSKQMMRRCARFIKTPPGSDWDGVERLNKKVFEVEDDPPDLLKNNSEGVAEEGFCKETSHPPKAQPAFPRESSDQCTTEEEHVMVPPPEDLVQITPRYPNATNSPTLCARLFERSSANVKASETSVAKGIGSCCRYHFTECGSAHHMACLLPSSCTATVPAESAERV